MRNLWLITKREFLSRLKSGAYITSTILIVLVFFASTFLPTLMDSSARKKPLDVQLLDKTGQVATPLKQVLDQAASSQPEQAGLPRREVKLTTAQGDEAALTEQVRRGDFALLVVDGTYPNNLTARFLASDMGSLTDAGAVTSALEQVVRAARMKERGLEPAVAQEIIRPLAIETRQLTAGDAERSQEQFFGNLILALGVIMSVYMITMMNSQFVFQGVLEEKVSRVVEVMAAAVRPGEMMLGKVLGLGALGLTQLGLMMVALAVGNAVSPTISGVPAEPLGLKLILLIIVFVLLSYLFNSCLMAALGATVSRMEDSQTVQTPVLMIIMLPIFLFTPVMNDPNSSFATILSFIPMFSPIIMLLRVMLGDVPAWQVALSVGLQLLATLGMAWVSGRIYRAALLTFGTRPTMKQLWQYLRAG